MVVAPTADHPRLHQRLDLLSALIRGHAAQCGLAFVFKALLNCRFEIGREDFEDWRLQERRAGSLFCRRPKCPCAAESKVRPYPWTRGAVWISIRLQGALELQIRD